MDKLKTILFIIGMTALFAWIGSFFGKGGIASAIFMAGAINGVMYFFSDKLIFGFFRARPMEEQQFPGVFHVVKELTHKMDLPMPKLALIMSPVANAITTGRNPNHASVGITTGSLELLNEKELRGVLAHELTHVKNRDILFATIASTIATAIGYLAQSLEYTTLRRPNPDQPSEIPQRRNPLGVMIATMIVPLAALLMRFAVSRSREYLADEGAAYVTRDPLALATALEKLHNSRKRESFNPRWFSFAAMAPLFIVNPLMFGAAGLSSLFHTHPPVEERIARLYAIHEKMQHGEI